MNDYHKEFHLSLIQWFKQSKLRELGWLTFFKKFLNTCLDKELFRTAWLGNNEMSVQDNGDFIIINSLRHKNLIGKKFSPSSFYALFPSDRIEEVKLAIRNCLDNDRHITKMNETREYLKFLLSSI
jgi:formylmethanofuran dehydrogenase subunit B